MTTWQLLCTDLARAEDQPVPHGLPGQLRLVASRLLTVRGLATIGFRLSHALGQRNKLVGDLVKQLNQVLTGCDIGHAAQIGPGLRMLHPGSVVINSHAVIGERFTIHSSVTIGGGRDAAPVIGDDVNVGPGARIIGPVRIGNRVRVGANAVLTKTIEGDDIVLAGVPAQIIRETRPSDFRIAGPPPDDAA